VGAGKTTLMHQLLRSVGDEVQIGLISNGHGDRGELLRWVLMALGQQAHAGEDYVDLFSRFQNYLIDEYAAGRRVILIFDEAQNLKNPKAAVSKAARALKAEHKIALTGTPMENHLGELWSLFDLVLPGYLGDHHEFREFFRNPH